MQESLPGSPKPGRQEQIVRRGGAVPGATHAGSVADVAWLIHNFSSRSRCIEGAVATAVPSAPGRSRLRGLFALMHSCTCHNICTVEFLRWKKTLPSMASCGALILGNSDVVFWRGHWVRKKRLLNCVCSVLCLAWFRRVSVWVFFPWGLLADACRQFRAFPWWASWFLGAHPCCLGGGGRSPRNLASNSEVSP